MKPGELLVVRSTITDVPRFGFMNETASSRREEPDVTIDLCPGQVVLRLTSSRRHHRPITLCLVMDHLVWVYEEDLDPCPQ